MPSHTSPERAKQTAVGSMPPAPTIGGTGSQSGETGFTTGGDVPNKGPMPPPMVMPSTSVKSPSKLSSPQAIDMGQNTRPVGPG